MTTSSERAGQLSVFANAAAGSADRQAVAGAVARLATRVPTLVHWSESADHLGDLIDDRRDDGLVFAGGDGSLHLALNVLDRLGLTDRPIGVVPLGTGNDFARNAGIPLDPEAAADVVLDGWITPMDAMVNSNGELVHNSAHFGVGVVGADRAAPMKRLLGRLAYPLATAITGLSHPGMRVTVRTDGRVIHDGNVLAVIVLLGPGLGGGAELVDGTAQGLETLVVVTPAHRLGRVSLAAALRRGGAHRDLIRRTADVVEIEALEELRANLDGELGGWGRSGSLRRVPEAWRVWTPPGTGNQHA